MTRESLCTFDLLGVREVGKAGCKEIRRSAHGPTEMVRHGEHYGASTGEHEAVELRDGDARYLGKGVLQAVDNVNGVIAESSSRAGATDQALVDRLLIELDGTPNKSKLGANAILGVSLAVAKAAPRLRAALVPLPRRRQRPHAARAHDEHPQRRQHADNNVDFQEFMIMPVGALTPSRGLRMGAEVFHASRRCSKGRGH